jgi:hypothetical protein
MIRCFVLLLVMLAPLTLHATPGPQQADPLPHLISEANAEAVRGDRRKLADTLGQIIRHIGQASDAELAEIEHLRGALIALAEPPLPPKPAPAAQTGCKIVVRSAALASLLQRDVFDRLAAAHGYARPEERNRLYQEFQQWAQAR